MEKIKLLTKTLIMKGFQCPKQLYLYLNHRDLAEEDKNQKQKNEGTEIGDLARTLYPNGLLIDEKNPQLALIQTEKNKDHPLLFEGAYLFKDVYCRIDILKQYPDGIELIEVKSSAEIKNYQIEDLAIQAYVLLNLGFKIKKLSLCNINKEFILGDPVTDFFVLVDKTAEIFLMLPQIEEKINRLRETIKTLPKIDIGPHCSKPFTCPFKSHCFKDKKITETSVLNFPYLNEKWELFNSGKTEINELTNLDLKTDNQKSFLAKFKAKEYFNLEGIKSKLDSWTFPIYFLDFETVTSVFPKYSKTRPNTNITYQYSLFCLDSISSEPILKQSYIASSLKPDPRIELAKNLILDIGDKGTIVSYNSGFEKSRIEEMAELIPELKEQLLAINLRIEDLLPVMREYVYLNSFKGSWSLKSVVPAIFGEKTSYKNQTVKNGLEAQAVYLNSLKAGDFLKVKQSLIDYCNKDVLELINLYKYLYNKIN